MVFQFEQREAVISFDRPRWLTGQLSVFEVDADGTHDVTHTNTADRIEIRDQVHVVGVFVATADRSL